MHLLAPPAISVITEVAWSPWGRGSRPTTLALTVIQETTGRSNLVKRALDTRVRTDLRVSGLHPDWR